METDFIDSFYQNGVAIKICCLFIDIKVINYVILKKAYCIKK